MKLHLIHKMLIALFASTAVVLLLILWLAQVNIGRGFQDFLLQQDRANLPNISGVLENWYEENGSWESLQGNRRKFNDLLKGVLSEDTKAPPRRPGNRPLPPEDSNDDVLDGPRNRPPAPPRRELPGPPPGRPMQGEQGPGGDTPLHQRIYLLDQSMNAVIGGTPADFDDNHLTPIEVNLVTVGWLGVSPVRSLTAPSEQAFAKLLSRTLLTGGAIGLLVAALLAWVLARHISRPLSAAAAGVRELVAGNYQTQVNVNGNDETAGLGRDINQLAMTLAEHEKSRQRWIADIAHELRTPLAIMRGEIEAMTDGVRELNEKNLASVHQEVGHLSALVNDLHTLAMSDTGALSFKMQRLNMTELVATVIESSHTRCNAKGLELGAHGLEKPVWVEGDEQRLRQLLHNLIENSVRYTDAPGKIEIVLTPSKSQLKLKISDSAPGVAVENLEQLFDRLFRVEASRNRNTGGSGLGLAICRNIVQAHGGKIDAEQSELGGISIVLELPVAP